MNSKSHQLNAYSKMLQIRTSENLIAEDYLQNKIFSFLHLSVGQEASAVGVCFNLDHEDIVLGNHRSHGHYLAKGGDLRKMFYEVYGHPLGCCKGIGGSMHMLDRSVNFMGSTPILGSLAPIGAGFAFKQKESGSKKIALSFIGDGSAEEGSFYESLNLAAKFNLPYVIVIEDNKYSVNSLHSDRKSRQYSYEKVVEGLGCKYLHTNGQDYEKVSEEVLKAKEIALSGTPVVLHLDVLRDYAHSGPIKDDGAHYRGEDTAEYRKNNCPINIYRASLIKNNLATDEQLIKIDAEVQSSCSAIFNEVRAVVKKEIGI